MSSKVAASQLWLLLPILAVSGASPWNDWWSYEGFSGPTFWGLVNPDWKMCDRGRHQSPINIDPQLLLFDPNMKPLRVDNVELPAVVANTGQQLVVTLDRERFKTGVNVSGGPLGGYQYQLQHMFFHFGRSLSASGQRKPGGSEHTIDGERFPAELQLLGFNTDLYKNFSDAMTKPQGLVGISVIIDVVEVYAQDASNVQLTQLTKAISQIQFRGQKTKLKYFSAFKLMPETDHFVTYEGSLTYPGCYETVTWIILNKPIYVTQFNLKQWQNTLQRSENKEVNPSWLGDNYRPLKELNKRLIRTNINFRTKQGIACPTMYKEMYYKANPWRKSNKPGRFRKRAVEAMDDRGILVD